MRKAAFAIIFWGLTIQNGLSQTVKTIQPVVGKKISLLPQQQAHWARAMKLLLNNWRYGTYDTTMMGDSASYLNAYYENQEALDSLIEKSKLFALGAEDSVLVAKLNNMEGPNLDEPGCSWYCGGGPYKITSSSELDSVHYKAAHIHDHNLLTAWVEGKKGYGIGEYVEFHFAPFTPRVNKIVVYNGYFRNNELWKRNSRIKKAKLYINGKLYAFLVFQDVNAPHTFSFPAVGSRAKDVDLVLKIEIMEVYKGTAHSDVAISDVLFDGLDVHCFAKGTKILMADASTKLIEALKPGDEVAQFDAKSNRLVTSKVKELEQKVHSALVRYRFQSGREIVATQDHPFRLKDKGWASLKPSKTGVYKGFDAIVKINRGDWFLTENGVDQLVAIEYIEGAQMTYTISKLAIGDSFIANGLVVGVEELDEHLEAKKQR